MKAMIFSLVLGISLVVTSSGYAEAALLEITPTNLKAGAFGFAITPKELPDGRVEFRVAITTKTENFNRQPVTDLSTVEIADRSQSIRPQRHLASERGEHSITCTFIVDRPTLNDRNFCFVFTHSTERVINGKVEFMPSATFIYARLKDFSLTVP